MPQPMPDALPPGRDIPAAGLEQTLKASIALMRRTRRALRRARRKEREAAAAEGRRTHQ
jgi:hypothetical protein